MEILIPFVVAGIVAALVLIIVAFAIVRAVILLSKKDRRGERSERYRSDFVHTERGIYHATIAAAVAHLREASAADPLVIKTTLRSF